MFIAKLTHLGHWVTYWSIFEFGKDFAELFESKLQIFSSKVRMTPRVNFLTNFLRLDFCSSSYCTYTFYWLTITLNATRLTLLCHKKIDTADLELAVSMTQRSLTQRCWMWPRCPFVFIKLKQLPKKYVIKINNKHFFCPGIWGSIELESWSKQF